MSWKQAATFLTVIFLIVTIQSVLAGPVVDIQNSLIDSGDYDHVMDGEAAITGMVSAWFNMGLVAIFVLMGVAIARVVRKELTKQRRGP